MDVLRPFRARKRTPNDAPLCWTLKALGVNIPPLLFDYETGRSRSPGRISAFPSCELHTNRETTVNPAISEQFRVLPLFFRFGNAELFSLEEYDFFFFLPLLLSLPHSISSAMASKGREWVPFPPPYIICKGWNS